MFFTNLKSRKGMEIAENPYVALNWFWAPHERQIRVEGQAVLVDPDQANAYWVTRPRESQVGAWASAQSQPIPEGKSLVTVFQETAARFADGPVPRPPHWSGIRVVPDLMELWQAGTHRLHDRTRYIRKAGRWERSSLFP